MAVETFDNEESNASVREKLNDTITAVQMLLQAGGGGGVIPVIVDYTGTWGNPISLTALPSSSLTFLPSLLQVNDVGSWVQDIDYYEDSNTGQGVTSISFPNLAGVIQDLELDTLNYVTSLEFPLLSGVGSDLILDRMALCTSVTMPELKGVGQQLRFNNFALLTSISLPLLEYASEFELANMNSLESVSVPNLKTLRNIYINSNEALLGISLDSLTTITDYFEASNLSSATSINLPVIERIGSINSQYGSSPNLTTINLGSSLKRATGSQNFNGCALSTDSVDHLLNVFASLDGTNGTTEFSQDLDLSGSNNSPFSINGWPAYTKMYDRGLSLSVNRPEHLEFTLTAGALGGGSFGYKQGVAGSITNFIFSSNTTELSSDGTDFVLTLIGHEAMGDILYNGMNLFIDDGQVDGNFNSNETGSFFFELNPEAVVPTFVSGQTYNIKIARFI